MPRKKHWLDSVSQSLRNDLEMMAEGVRDTFRDVVPVGHKPVSRKQKLARFLALPQEARMTLFTELGPEGYSDFVMEQMDELVRAVGPAASRLMPYFFSGLPTPTQEPSVEDVRGELDELLGFNVDEEDGLL